MLIWTVHCALDLYHCEHYVVNWSMKHLIRLYFSWDRTNLNFFARYYESKGTERDIFASSSLNIAKNAVKIRFYFRSCGSLCNEQVSVLYQLFVFWCGVFSFQGRDDASHSSNTYFLKEMKVLCPQDWINYSKWTDGIELFDFVS